MAEEVSTGGLMSFKYDKSHSPKLKAEQKKEISEAYEKYYERKRKEKRRKAILLVVVIILLAALLSFLIK